jgi:hypothetical protein
VQVVIIYYIAITLLAGLAIGLFSYNRRRAGQRRQKLAAWACGRGLQFNETKSHRLAEQFPEFDCLRQGDNRYAYNIMEGDWSGRPFFGFDYHYSTDSKGNDRHFSAVILESDILLKPLLMRPEGLFGKVTEFFGCDELDFEFTDIDFESAEFTRRFRVKAQDKRWAYDVIHQRTMEFLLSQPTFMFVLRFDFRRVIAYRGSTFTPAEFEQAANVICGILDLLPDYVRRQQQPDQTPFSERA